MRWERRGVGSIDRRRFCQHLLLESWLRSSATLSVPLRNVSPPLDRSSQTFIAPYLCLIVNRTPSPRGCGKFLAAPVGGRCLLALLCVETDRQDQQVRLICQLYVSNSSNAPLRLDSFIVFCTFVFSSLRRTFVLCEKREI